MITPTVLFGLETPPLTKTQLERIDGIQRKMLRSVTGWVRVQDESWAESMRRVNARVAEALRLFPVKPWTEQLACRKILAGWSFGQCESCSWPAKAIRWNTQFDNETYRLLGRPRQKWDDDLEKFAKSSFPQYNSWIDAASTGHEWLAKKQDFVNRFVP